MAQRVLVIGGGVVGLEAARRLALDGLRVTVVEAGSALGHGCSYGNAGLVAPSYCLPLANSQALRDGVRWLFDRGSPLTLAPWRDPHMAAWLLRFASSARPAIALRGARILHQLASESHAAYRTLNRDNPSLGLQSDGWLHSYLTREGFLHGRAQARALGQLGVNWVELDAKGARAMEDLLSAGTYGAILYPDESHFVPDIATALITDEGRKAGVQFHLQTEVIRLKRESGAVTRAVTSSGDIRAEWFVLAAGAWTVRLLRSLEGPRLPVQPATGYSVTLPHGQRIPARPVLLAEAHVVVTPMSGRLRITGGLDLLGFHERPGSRRLNQIRQAVPDYLRETDPTGGVEWFGYRPLSPDSLPVIGALRRFPNVIVATGHGTLGMTLAPATGRLISDVIHGRRQGDDTRAAVSPARYGL